MVHCAMVQLGCLLWIRLRSSPSMALVFFSCSMLLRVGIVVNYSGAITGRPRGPI